MTWLKTSLISLFLLIATVVPAHAEHAFQEIDTCYHWLETYQLKAKIEYAQMNNGEMQIYENRPIYCWRSPLGSASIWEDHGPELIRIKFKPNVRIIHHTRLENHDQINALNADVIYSNDNSWHEYTVTSSAIESWSIYRKELIEEMRSELKYYDSGMATENDVFYPFQYFRLVKIHNAINPIIRAFKKLSKTSSAQIYGLNPERHFDTNIELPWRQYMIK